ncbi:MAG: hypothetical protein KC643_32915, partial [Nitrospira sp.]|nr:hypothetical protein [Nitrospira sp.]
MSPIPYPPTRRKKGLTKKLVLSMLLVGILPLVIGLFLAFYQGTQEIQEVNGASFETLATETARKLDLVVSEEMFRTSLLATDVTIIAKLENLRDSLNELSPETRNQLLTHEQTAWETKDPILQKNVLDGPIAQILQRHMGGTFIDPGHPVPVITRSATRGMYITDRSGRVVASLDAAVSYLHQETVWWKG